MADRNVWVVGCGDKGRRDSVKHWFRTLAVCAIGPAKKSADLQPSDSVKKVIERFYNIRPGDVVLLRGGREEIRGVGVTGTPEFSREIKIAGWNLGHVAPTDWLSGESEKTDLKRLECARSKQFPPNRFTRLGSEQKGLEAEAIKVVEAAGLTAPTSDFTAPETFPNPAFAAKVMGLVDKHADTKTLEEVLTEARAFGTDSYPRLEADTVAMVVVPLLKALGVPSQNIRVEVPRNRIGTTTTGAGPADHRRVDVVVFADETTVKPVLLVEAKRRWEGLDYAHEQLENYIHGILGEDKLGRLVTDGADIEFTFKAGPDKAWTYLNLSWRTEGAAKALADLAASLKAGVAGQ